MSRVIGAAILAMAICVFAARSENALAQNAPATVATEEAKSKPADAASTTEPAKSKPADDRKRLRAERRAEKKAARAEKKARASAARNAVRERQKQCGAEWREQRKAGTIAKTMTWPKFWSACNLRLKAGAG